MLVMYIIVHEATACEQLICAIEIQRGSGEVFVSL